jgi:hypothetical protein
VGIHHRPSLDQAGGLLAYLTDLSGCSPSLTHLSGLLAQPRRRVKGQRVCTPKVAKTRAASGTTVVAAATRSAGRAMR